MKKITVAFLFFASSFLVTSAQQAATTINARPLATVNIYNATSTQKGNNFSISFDLANRLGIQPGIKYSALLTKDQKGINTIADEHVYDEVINLGEQSSVHKTIIYTAPANLEGDFTLLVSSKNTSGFPFGMAMVGKVHLVKSEADTSGIILDVKSCYLTVEGEKNSPHYTPLQVVDIAPTENLQSNCILENTSNSPLTVTPSFSTHLRSNFGGIVTTSGGDISPVVFSSHEKKVVTTSLPKSNVPQLYRVTLVYGDTRNAVSYSYIVQGGSGTIQNIILDKDTYLKGEVVDMSFMWSSFTNGLRGIRKGLTSALTNPSFTVVLTDEEGKDCANSFNQTLNTKETVVHAKILITEACYHPKVDVTLSDAKLGTLSHFLFNTGTTTPSLLQKEKTNSGQKGSLAVILVILLVGLVSLLRKKNLAFKTPLSLVILVGMSMILGVKSAKADTFCDPFNDGCATVSTDKSSYVPGEQMTIFGSVQNTAAPTSVNSITLKYGINSPASITMISTSQMNYMDTASASASGNAPSSAGNYAVNFYLYCNTYDVMAGYGDSVWANYAYPFAVSVPVPPPTPTVSIHFSFLNTVKTQISDIVSGVEAVSFLEKTYAAK